MSVPSAKHTRPAPTAAAEPLLLPPEMNRESKGVEGTAEEGERVPTRPAANWSMLVLPTAIPPVWSGGWKASQSGRGGGGGGISSRPGEFL